MTPEQAFALLLTIADQRIAIEQLRAQLTEPKEANGIEDQPNP